MTDNTPSRTPRVIIVGAGFAGLQLAKKLGKRRKGEPALDVILLDKNNHHTFQPLLYQVATGGLEPDSISYPIRRALRGVSNVKFQMGEVKMVDTSAKRVTTESGDLDYDYLVLATGSTNNFFQFDSTSNQLLPLKSVPDALNIRNFILQNLEQVTHTQDPNQQTELMNIAIIGGGPAGVELAGALGEMKRHVLPKDFPNFDFSRMSITVFEAAPRLLGAMSQEASDNTKRYLEDIGVEVRVGAKVDSYDSKRLLLADGSEFPARSVIWTAGVKGNPVEGISQELINPGRRIQIDQWFRVRGMADVFALGDCAACQTDKDPRGLPMMAAVAMDQAAWLGDVFAQMVSGKEVEPYVFNSKGTMATIGRNRAVVDLPRWKFHGPFAWFVWMFIHILSLIGFRNKLVTLVDWLFNYVNYDRPLNAIHQRYQRPGIEDSELKTY